MKRLLGGAALILCFPMSFASGAVLDAAALIGSLARDPPATISFAEARFSPLLDEPLIVSGRLSYFGPGSFDREVTGPYRETTAIRGESVRVDREGEDTRTFALKRAPELSGLLASFVALLSGNAAAVTREFDVSTSGSDARWAIELSPLDARQRRRLQRIVVGGAGDEANCFVVLTPQGGGTVMLLGDSAANRMESSASLDDLLQQCRVE